MRSTTLQTGIDELDMFLFYPLNQPKKSVVKIAVGLIAPTDMQLQEMSIEMNIEMILEINIEMNIETILEMNIKIKKTINTYPNQELK